MVLSRKRVEVIVHSFSAHRGEFDGDLNAILDKVAYENNCCRKTTEKYLRQEGAIPETWQRKSRRNYTDEQIQAARDRFNTYLKERYQGNITSLLSKVAEDCRLSSTAARMHLTKEIYEFKIRKLELKADEGKKYSETKKTEQERKSREKATKKETLTPKLKKLAVDAYQVTGYPPDAAEMTGLTIEQIVYAWSKDNLEVQPNRRDLTGRF